MSFWVAGAVLGGSLISGIAGSVASKDAANAQTQAADASAEAQKYAADKSAQVQTDLFNKQVDLQEPFRQAGISGQNRLMDLLGLGKDSSVQGYGKYAKDFSMSDFQQDPGYAFRLSEGLKALDQQAAARGGLISGAALKGATRYGQDAASQEYTNAFNRYQTNRTNQIAPLQSLFGAGQSASNALTNAAGTLGSNLGQTYQNLGTGLGETALQAGNARASGYVGNANAWSSAINGGINNYMNMSYLNKLSSPSLASATSAGIANNPYLF